MKYSIKISTYIVVLLTALCNTSYAQQSGSGSTSGLNITDDMIRLTGIQGMKLYSYFKAYDVAIDTLHKFLGNNEVPPAMGAGPVGTSWSFSWGEFEEPYTYVVKYGITVDSAGHVEVFDIFNERYVNETHYILAARARAAVIAKYEATKKVFKLEDIPYRVAVLPYTADEIQVFIAPVQNSEESTLFGADMYYSVHRTNSRITSMFRYHHTVMQIPKILPDDAEAALLVPDAPLFSPMDVANTVARNKTMIVVTKSGAYRIYPDGKVGRSTPPSN